MSTVAHIFRRKEISYTMGTYRAKRKGTEVHISSRKNRTTSTVSRNSIFPQAQANTK